MTDSAKLRVQIHCACRDLGLDADARHDIQLAACGKASMKDMDPADMQKVLDHLKERGWGHVQKGFRKPAAPRGDLRFVHVLWRLLGEAGVLSDPTRAGLNSFIRSRFGGSWESVPIDVDALRDHKQIAQIINALKDWCGRVGVDLEQ